jgi:dTMP kinase
MGRILQRGVFLVIEGIDGAGKSTQAHRLGDRLRDDGFDCLNLREPTDGPFGRRIRELARAGRASVTPAEELELFVQDRRQNVAENLAPALAARRIVILDRYYFSTMAYQGARGCDPEEIRREHEQFAPLPDVLFHLAIPLDLVEARIEQSRGQARDHFEKIDLLREVKANFDRMDFPYLRRIDGDRDQELVSEEVHRLARETIDPLIID